MHGLIANSPRIGEAILVPMLALFLIVSGVMPAVSAPLDQEMECIIEPHATVKVGSPAAGILAAVEVGRGDIVKQGQVIGRTADFQRPWRVAGAFDQA